MPRPAPSSELRKPLHPRNPHGGRYDFAQLIACEPSLAAFVARNAWGDESIDFADPQAVRALNRALLRQVYGVGGWALPEQYLCPPIPGRADYLHYLADLLARSNGGEVPHGAAIGVLDVGVGANVVYPLIGHSVYGWRFVGSDIDRNALTSAQTILDANPGYRDAVELRWQSSRRAVFNTIVQPDEVFDLVMSNPPFHASIEEAKAGSERKWKNLGKSTAAGAPVLNFGGRSEELCCPGGEEGFVGRMIVESRDIQNQVLWFTSLVSKATSLPAICRALKAAGVAKSRTIEMAQGQKKSRIVVWTFLNERQHQAWRNRHRAETR